MEEKIQKMEELKNEDLVVLYENILNHIKYLDDNVILIEEENEKEGDSNDE